MLFMWNSSQNNPFYNKWYGPIWRTSSTIAYQIRFPVFEEKLSSLEKTACKPFKNNVTNYLGNHKNNSSKNLFNEILFAYQVITCDISSKIPFLTHNWIFSWELERSVMSPDGIWFHHDILKSERSHQCRLTKYFFRLLLNNHKRN